MYLNRRQINDLERKENFMKQLAFCEYCMDEIKYKVNSVNKISILLDEEMNYIGKEAICTECENEIFCFRYM